MTVDELLIEYIAVNPAIRSNRTQQLLAVVVRNFCAYLGRAAIVADFTDRNITGYMRHRREIGRSETTLQFEAIKLMALWRFAASQQLIAGPTIRIRRQPPETPKALLQSQIRDLFAAAVRATGIVGDVPRSVLFPALLGVIWESAERITAVHSLKRGDIDLVRREVTFRNRKGSGRTLRKPITRATASAVGELLAATTSEQPFAPVGVTTLYHHLDRIFRDAGVPIEKRQKFHALRKSHASHLEAAGGNARASLDHSSDTVTIRHYIDPAVANSRRAVDLLFSPYSFWQRAFYWFRWLRSAIGL